MRSDFTNIRVNSFGASQIGVGEGRMRRMAGTRPDRGRPVTRETWDRQYRDGTWEWLDSIGEFAHYMVIAGYVHYLFKSPTILDVGCGQGRLAELLGAFSITRYLGIDLSAEAIQHARRRIRSPARFRVADLNAWHPPGRFSVIVFCESLNYAIHPVSTLVRYAGALEKDGAIIVSLVRHRNHGRIWKNAARHFRTADSTTVINPQGVTWDIRVLRPAPLTSPLPTKGGRGHPGGTVPGSGQPARRIAQSA